MNFSIMLMFMHSFMVYKYTSKLTKRMNRAICNFVWSDLMDDHKVITVSWSKCCLLVKKEALDIKNLGLFYKCLLGKFVWKFLSKSTFAFLFFR